MIDLQEQFLNLVTDLHEDTQKQYWCCNRRTINISIELQKKRGTIRYQVRWQERNKYGEVEQEYNWYDSVTLNG